MQKRGNSLANILAAKNKKRDKSATIQGISAEDSATGSTTAERPKTERSKADNRKTLREMKKEMKEKEKMDKRNRSAADLTLRKASKERKKDKKINENQGW